MDLQDIKNLCEGKRVLLVGNSVEMMNHENAELIDSYDVVVRFGRGIDYGEKEAIAIGKKLDIWVTGLFRQHMLDYERFRNMIEGKPTLLNTARVSIKFGKVKLNKHLKNYNTMFSDREILQKMKEYGIPDSEPDARRLSAGMWALFYFTEKVQTYKSLTLIGFDFFAKKTHKKRGGTYEPASWHIPISTGKFENHWHEQEVAITRQLEAEGKLEWKILSNLSGEWIDGSKHGTF